MIRAEFIESCDFDADSIESIEIDKKTVLGNPSYLVAIYLEMNPKIVLKLYLNDEADCFHEVKSSDSSVVIGLGEKVHIFNTDTSSVVTYKLRGYFGHLYPFNDPESDYFNDTILVASASDLLLLTANGKLIWKSDVLGIDGVVVDSINSEVIEGKGEYDPPGGWEKYKVSSKNGKSI